MSPDEVEILESHAEPAMDLHGWIKNNFSRSKLLEMCLSGWRMRRLISKENSPPPLTHFQAAPTILFDSSNEKHGFLWHWAVENCYFALKVGEKANFSLQRHLLFSDKVKLIVVARCLVTQSWKSPIRPCIQNQWSPRGRKSIFHLRSRWKCRFQHPGTIFVTR